MHSGVPWEPFLPAGQLLFLTQAWSLMFPGVQAHVLRCPQVNVTKEVMRSVGDQIGHILLSWCPNNSGTRKMLRRDPSLNLHPCGRSKGVRICKGFLGAIGSAAWKIDV